MSDDSEDKPGPEELAGAQVPQDFEDGLPSISPDFVEQQFPESIDNIVPTHGYEMTPMVGLGGSAGSIPELIAFFRAMPPDSGMVFVVILHLSPTHHSTLAELLGRNTEMPVIQAEDGVSVEPNHVYVIPPAKYLTSVDGRLNLTDMDGDHGRRVAVDVFFRSLADSHGPHSIGVIFSGVDGDGALGIKRIKERGGLTIAQDPGGAEHSGMPRTAINTGMIDWVLETPAMPARIVDFLRQEARLRLPSEDGPLRAVLRAPAEDGEAALRDVLTFVAMRTGRDFSCYKRATVLRRIARRMQVNGLDTIESYVTYLRTHPGEAGALLQDLLISVTNFFRDREAFAALENLIPRLFEGKTGADSIRVWVPACATGEEAYSIAMLLLEHAATLDLPPTLQVFACDLNDEAIQLARAGRYPETITADVSEERIRRFFVRDGGLYRVRRELREMVLFATHDLLKDAPFSRMDLISCRNLLIYLDRDAQRRVLDVFRFALKPAGLLFLGSSESVEDASFPVVDKKHRIYVHTASVRPYVPVPLGAGTLMRTLQAHEAATPPPVVHGKRFVHDAVPPFIANVGRDLDRVTLSELHFKLIERYGPPSLIVDADHEIVHLSEHVGRFLQHPGGEPTRNVIRMVDPALRVELHALLLRAAETNSAAYAEDVPADIEGHHRLVTLRVTPAPEMAPGFLLVTFEMRDGESAERDVSGATSSSHSVAQHLEREVAQLKARLRDTVEQYEASTEELKASNEELQAMNEELRSATEELETSREELQSINEELATVNQEMKSKVDELANANSDLQNLMGSTAIATVFLDRALTIMRYTPNASALFNMIPGDIGRPIAHLKHRLDYPDLLTDAEAVLRTLVPIEHEVTDGERWFLVRLQPYRTLEDHIAGVVLTLIDTTDRTLATEALRRSEQRLRLVMESAQDFAIFTTDIERRVDSWNSGAQNLFGFTEQEILGESADVLFTPEDRGDAEGEAKIAAEQGRAENERWHLRKDGTRFYGSGLVMPLRDKNEKVVGFLKIMRDLTERVRAQDELRERMDELQRFNAAAVGRETRMIELKNEVNELCRRIGERERYALAETESGGT